MIPWLDNFASDINELGELRLRSIYFSSLSHLVNHCRYFFIKIHVLYILTCDISVKMCAKIRRHAHHERIIGVT